LEAERIALREKVWEAAWRYGSLELNTNSGVVRGVRIATSSGWAIYSARGGRSWRELEEKAGLIRRRLRGSMRLVGVDKYDGRVTLGVVGGDPEDSILDAAARMGGLLEEKGLKGEIIVVVNDASKRIEHEAGVAEERRAVTEIYVYADARIRGRRSIGSSAHIMLGGPEGISGRLAESLVEKAAHRAVYGLKAEPLGPLDKGKYEVILAGEASAAFLHELGHLLEADQPGHLKRGVRISNLSIAIRDDPFTPGSPASRAFDDEAVSSTRRVLVEDGIVEDLLHTRETAYRLSGKPGSARGLFHIPKAMHTTLILEPGDWRGRHHAPLKEQGNSVR